MSKIKLVAAAMWREEARKAGALGVARRRTVEAFENESHETQDKWIGFARVAMNALIAQQEET